MSEITATTRPPSDAIAAPETLAAGATGFSARRMSRKMAGELVAVYDFAAIVCTAWISGVGYSLAKFGDFGHTDAYLGGGILAGALVVGSLAAGKHYAFERFASVWGQIGPIFTRWTIAVLLLLAAAFLTKTSADFSRGWAVTWYGIGFAALIGSRPVIRNTFSRLSAHGRVLGHHVALVGATPLAQRFLEQAAEKLDHVTLVGIFDDRGPERDGRPADLAISGSVAALIARAQAGEIDEIIVALPWSAEDRIRDLVRRLSVLPVSIHLCPDQIGLHYTGRDYASVAGVKVLEANPRPLHGWAGVAKDVFDRTAAGFMLLALLPLFLGVVAAIKFDSRGPVFFKQRRHGFNHRMFQIYKFRSMTCLEDGATVTQARKNDARVTRIGAILRRTSIDELPQLINVLRGEMSLVGPRPHAVAHNDEYSRIIEDYAVRHRVRPGITGLAQVNGYRGETATPQAMAGRVEHDLFYIENWSMMLDFRILLMTVQAVLFPKNAY